MSFPQHYLCAFLMYAATILTTTNGTTYVSGSHLLVLDEGFNFGELTAVATIKNMFAMFC